MALSTTTHRARRTWHILGTGAMACLWAASLAAAGHTVRLRGRVPPAREAYHDVIVTTAAGAQRLRVCLEGHADAGAIERLLVCTKAPDAASAVGAIGTRLARGADVVLLQNGMGFQHAIRERIPHAWLYCAVTTEGAWLEAPLRVRHAGRGQTLLGLYPHGEIDRCERLAQEFAGGFIMPKAVADIEPVLWRKLAVNCAINPLTALHGCRNGDLLDDPALAREFSALCAELEQVFAALGQARVALELREEAVRVARATAANRSSMLQDLDAGRRTEIGFITGFLAERAAAAGIACPLNDALLAALRAREPR